MKYLLLLLFFYSPMQLLESYKWKNRLVILLSSSLENEVYMKQNVLLSGEKEELIDRKIILIHIIDDNYQIIDYNTNSIEKWKPLDNELKSIVDQDANFQVILLGLDGGIKRKQTEVLLPEILFNQIDKMPMRISELKGRE